MRWPSDPLRWQALYEKNTGIKSQQNYPKTVHVQCSSKQNHQMGRLNPTSLCPTHVCIICMYYVCTTYYVCIIYV